MALSRTEIQKKSDQKRGIKSKGYKLPVDIIDLITELSSKTGKPQSKVIEDAILMYKNSL